MATVGRPVVSRAPASRVKSRWQVGLVKCRARACTRPCASGGRIAAAARGEGAWELQ